MLDTGRHYGQPNRTDMITRAVEEMVVSREPVSRRQFRGTVTLVAAQIARRFDLSIRGAEQAVEPIMNRLVPVIDSVAGTTRRR